jgi:hypothetical protein
MSHPIKKTPARLALIARRNAKRAKGLTPSKLAEKARQMNEAFRLRQLESAAKAKSTLPPDKSTPYGYTAQTPSSRQ